MVNRHGRKRAVVTPEIAVDIIQICTVISIGCALTELTYDIIRHIYGRWVSVV